MRIESVDSLLLGDAHVVLITTDSGLQGLGQSGCWGYPGAVDRVVGSFRTYLIGQDPRDIERHWHHLYRMGPFRGSVLTSAVSAVDIALWDLKGKHLQAPVWDLLGGRFRDKVRLHVLLAGGTPDQVVAQASAAVTDGFSAVKFDPLPPSYADMALPRLVEQTKQTVAAARDAVGPDVDILLELHRKLTPLQARPLIDALRALQPLFVEDPIQIDSITVQAQVAKDSRVPVGNGERLHTIWEFEELLRHGGCQYVRPDVGLAGGISHCRKIAAVAEAHHAVVVTHNCLVRQP